MKGRSRRGLHPALLETVVADGGLAASEAAVTLLFPGSGIFNRPPVSLGCFHAGSHTGALHS